MGRSRSRSRSRERRKRSRSRSRERRRSRSRSRGRRESREDRSRFLVTDSNQENIAAQIQQQQLQQLQQQQLQKQLLAQQLMMASAGQMMAAAMPPPLAGMAPNMGVAMPVVATPASGGGGSDRKQREVYVGNLAIGVISAELLQEFFNKVFAHMTPDPTSQPPVVNLNMDSTGRFAFVELRTEEMTEKAVQMDKVVELCGRQMNIGRPKGYVPPPPRPMGGMPAAPSLASVAAQASGPQPTTVVMLSGLLPAGKLRGVDDRKILELEVHEEAARHGAVASVAVPPPPATVQDRMPGRCYIKYQSTDDAKKGRSVFDGRTLDGNKIKAVYVPEEEFAAAATGEWVSKQAGVAGIPLPGLYNLVPLQSGIAGLTALNPALAALVTTNPGIAAMMTAGINDDEVPYEEGWVKLRGFARHITKAQVVEFMQNCGVLTEDDVKLVLSADGTPLGEAFIQFRGPNAKVRLALAKDRSVMPASGTAIEVFTAVEADGQRRMLSGCVLV